MSRRNVYILSALVLCFTFLPWLGLTLFNTKGEPREAIVAWSMLNTGDWILPQSCGGDIPYKPPFLAWLIAAFSWALGGEVTEYTSRLPSALAAIALGLSTLRFFAKNTGSMAVGLLTAGVTVTAFEVFRAASACRVDMVLTACTVGAIYLLYPTPRLRVWPVVLMTCAVLTKGPVGMLLPCLVVWLFYLLRGCRFWPSTFTLAMMGLLSLVVPALWYYAAAQQGGQEFIDLAMEENVGRMTGTMSYESHVNPFWYNFVTIIAGMLPYTLLALLALTAVKKRPLKPPTPTGAKPSWLKAQSSRLAPASLLSIVAVVAIVGFYCIPASKRSVYLLPAYPFMAYWVAQLMVWLARNKPAVLKAYATFIGGVALLFVAALLAVKYAPLASVLSGLKPQTAAMAMGLRSWHWDALTWVLLAGCVWAGAAALRVAWRREPMAIAGMSVAALFVIYWNLSATASPPVLNTKSDISVAREIQRLQPTGHVYSYNEDRLLRYYTANFYLHDRIKPYRGQPVADGALLVVGKQDYPRFLEKYGHRVSALMVRRDKKRKSCDSRQPVLLVRLHNREPNP